MQQLKKGPKGSQKSCGPMETKVSGMFFITLCVYSTTIVLDLLVICLSFNGFSETALMFSKAVAELDHMVMKMVAKSYGIEEHYKLLHGSITYLLRFIKYLSPQDNERNLGIVPHTDKSFMSILHQKEVKGLEIKTKDGEWIEVDPSSSSFIVMAGDACMVVYI